jgi:peptidyl-prolyl cis-trans isomerase D
MEAAAAAAGGQVTHQLGLRQIGASQYAQTLGQQFLQEIFQAKPGAPFIAGSDVLKGMVVARVDAVHPADPSQVASILPLLAQRSDEAYLQGLAGAVHGAALKMIKPRTDLALARTAIGVDSATVAKLSAKPGAKGAGLAK